MGLLAASTTHAGQQSSRISWQLLEQYTVGIFASSIDSNLAYMILIPKKEEALTMGDYQPISLVHIFTKLVTKILARRLTSKLNELVHAN